MTVYICVFKTLYLVLLPALCSVCVAAAVAVKFPSIGDQ